MNLSPVYQKLLNKRLKVKLDLKLFSSHRFFIFVLFSFFIIVLTSNKVALSQEKVSSRNNIPDISGVLVTGLVAILGTIAGGVVKGYWDARLAEKDFQSKLILRALEADDGNTRITSLKFLVTTNLISDRKIRKGIYELIQGGQENIPQFGSSLKLASQFETLSFNIYTDPTGLKCIGYGHVLTPEELRIGKILIDGKPITFNAGITEQQAQKLLDQDLEPYRQGVDKLVTVKLDKNQREAIVSFAFNVGLGTLEESTLLKTLNAGKFEEVPNELRKYVRVGGNESLGMVKRREAEIELWNRKT